MPRHFAHLPTLMAILLSVHSAEAKAKPSRYSKHLPMAPALPNDSTRMSIALFPLQTVEIPEGLVRTLEDALLTEIDEVGRYVAVTPNDVQNDLRSLSSAHAAYEQPFSPARCKGNSVCLSIAGRYARSHYAIETRVSGVAGTIKVAMRFFDTVRQIELSRAAGALSEERLKSDLHRLAIRLLQPQTFVGSLQVECDEAAAEVFLNDQLVGTTPLKYPIRGLTVGPHILRVSKEGFRDVYQFAEVIYQKRSTYRVNLKENTITSELLQAENRAGYGELLVQSDTGVFELRIDGAPLGSVPTDGAPIEHLVAGQRRMSLRYQGGPPIQTGISIERGRQTVVRLQRDDAGKYRIQSVDIIDPSRPTPTDPAQAAFGGEKKEWGWRLTGGLVAGGLGVLGLGAGAFFSAQVSDYNAQAEEIRLESTELNPAPDLNARAQRLNEQGDDAERNQLLAYRVGGALLLVGAGLAAWDLARVWGDSPDSPDSDSKSRPSGTRSLQWQAAPLDGGAVVGVRVGF